MDVRSGRRTGGAGPSNHRPTAQPLSSLYIDGGEVGVNGSDAGAVVHDDHEAVSPLGSRELDPARGHYAHGRAQRDTDVHAPVELVLETAPVPEPVARCDGSVHGPARNGAACGSNHHQKQ